MHKSYEEYNITNVYDERAFAKKGLFGFNNWGFGAKSGAGANSTRAYLGIIGALVSCMAWFGARVYC